MSWHYPKKGPKSAPRGIRLRKPLNANDTWWSDQWMKSLKTFTKPHLFERGHKYATDGHVLSVHVDKGFAEALVQCSRVQPFKVELGLPMLSQSESKRAADALTKKAFFVAKLLAGDLPREIVKLFKEAKIPLFPTSAADLASDCSCPEEKAPCKHIIAVYYILGQEFDRDPYILLEMRGLPRAQLLNEIQLRRSTKKQVARLQSPVASPEFPAQTTLAAHLNDFFNAPKDLAVIREGFNILQNLPPAGGRIKELGAPPFWQSDHSFEDVLNGIYKMVRIKILGNAKK